MKTSLLIVDPQNDFCVPGGSPANDGANMYVSGASDDMDRLANFIWKNLEDIDDIFITLDTHNYIDIGHCSSWIDNKTKMHVWPFTEIRSVQLVSGEYSFILDEDYGDRALEWLADPDNVSYKYSTQTTRSYLLRSESQGYGYHTVWPVHCMIGSYGHNIYYPLLKAICAWELMHKKNSVKITKGADPLFEQFSPFKKFNLQTGMYESDNHHVAFSMEKSDRILVAGEASSHCVKQTVEDYIDLVGGGVGIFLLDDAMSPVDGYREESEKFFHRAHAQGARLTATSCYSFTS